MEISSQLPPAPPPLASKAHPSVPSCQGWDANKNAWAAENKLKLDLGRLQPGGLRSPFLKGPPECLHLLFCAHKCHPIAEAAAEAELQGRECLPGALASGLSARAVRLPRLQYQPS